MIGIGIDINMVLTVTINPLLEKRFEFTEFEPGSVHRTSNLKFNAGGKGLNISRQLTKLGIKNQAITFAGGNNGKIFRKVLAEEGIDTVFVNMKSELRWSATIEEHKKKRVTHFFSPDHDITEKEADEFISRLEKMIPNASIIIFAGSSPNKIASRIFDQGIDIAHKEDKIVLLDTYGNHLQGFIEKAPMILHNNLEEINSSLNLNLTSEEDITGFLKQLYNKGIKIAFISNGKKTFYGLKFGFIYKITPPVLENEIDSIGSGDAFNSGIAAGLEKGLTFDEFVNLGCKLGALNSISWETCAVNRELIDSCPDAKIENIGKKLKLIDDSPTI